MLHICLRLAWRLFCCNYSGTLEGVIFFSNITSASMPQGLSWAWILRKRFLHCLFINKYSNLVTCPPLKHKEAPSYNDPTLFLTFEAIHSAV